MTLRLRLRGALLLPLLAASLAACATVTSDPAHPEAPLYAPEADASSDVDGALVRAAVSGKRVLLVMGANWCHDSRALAGWLESPRFAALTDAHYEVVYVDVGVPQTGEGRNLDIARRFGLDEFPGTPALLVLTAEGRAVNLDTAASWRNAASRSEDAIYTELEALAATAPEIAPETHSGTMLHVRGDAAACQFALSSDGPWLDAITSLPIDTQGLRFNLRANPQTPWRCVAAGIYALQQSGAQVGFVSDPAG